VIRRRRRTEIEHTEAGPEPTDETSHEKVAASA
jgi:hypothetical protein